MKVSVFEYEDYKDFLRKWISQSPNNGRGQIKKISEFANMHSTLVSQILKGDRHFSMEQALQVSKYLELEELAQEYFMGLVEYEKAGSYELKYFVKQRMVKIKDTSLKLSERIKNKKALSDEDKKIFYSHWSYTALWVSFSLEKINTIEQAATFLEIPLSKTKKVCEFLLSCGLLIEEEGKIKNSASVTHIADDPLILSKHHGNWRHKAMEHHPIMSKDNLSYTAPLTISEEDFLKVREKIVGLIKEMIQTVEKTKPEKVVFLNLDWISLI